MVPSLTGPLKPCFGGLLFVWCGKPRTGDTHMSYAKDYPVLDGNGATIVANAFDPALGPELIANGVDFTNTDGIIAQEVSLSVANGLLTITADQGNNDRAEWELDNLIIGETYTVKCVARRGNNSGQRLAGFTWGSLTTIVLNTDNGYFTEYVQDVVATATSGVCRLYSLLSGSVGTSLIVRELSVKRKLS